MSLVRTTVLTGLLLAASTVSAHAGTFTCITQVRLNLLPPTWTTVQVQADTPDQAATLAQAAFRARFLSPQFTIEPVTADRCF